VLLHPIPDRSIPGTKTFDTPYLPGARAYDEDKSPSMCTMAPLHTLFSDTDTGVMSSYAEVASKGNIYLAFALTHLATLITEKIRRLTTFSFRYALWPEEPHNPVTSMHQHSLTTQRAPMEIERGQLHFPLHVVARLVESLPRSCTQVEVSTAGRDKVFHPTETSEHSMTAETLSEALSKVLPQLSHLSLDASLVSSFVFKTLLAGESLPKMQSLRLDISDLVLTDHEISLCADSDLFLEGVNWVWDTNHDRYAPLQWQPIESSQPLQNWVARELQTRYQKHFFPAISDLLLVAIREEHPRYISAYLRNVIDIISERVSVLPLASLPVYGDLNLPSDELWTFKTESKGLLILMDRNQMKNCCNTTWVSSTNGVRIPADQQRVRTI
jgi:hypothetical protein